MTHYELAVTEQGMWRIYEHHRMDRLWCGVMDTEGYWRDGLAGPAQRFGKARVRKLRKAMRGGICPELAEIEVNLYKPVRMRARKGKR